MIKLTKITKNDNTITCLAFIEDCKESVNLIYDIKSGNFEKYTLPKNYEYCTSHIAYAKRYFDRVIDGKEELLGERLFMWY